MERTVVRQQAVGSTQAGGLLARAESIYARAEYDSAITVFTEAGRVADAEADTLTRARAWTSIGLANWRLGRYEEAQRWGEDALLLKQRMTLTPELFRSYNALGLLAHDQGRFGAAIDLFNKAEAAARAVGDSVSVAKAIGNRGLPHVGTGQFDLAKSEFAVLRRVGRDAGNAVAEANALSNLGMVAIRSGDPRGAIEPLEQGLAIARGAGHAVGEENALGQLGTAYDAMGDARRALAYLDSALVIARRRGMKREESDDLQLIAAVYSGGGEHRRALEYLSRAGTISEELGLQDTGGDIAREQARSYVALGDLDRARARTLAARRLHALAGAPLEQIEDELIIAELSQRMGTNEATRAAILSARALATRVNAPIARAKLALGLARVAEAAGDPRGVLSALNDARTELSAGGSDFEWESNALRARALLKLQRYDQAVAAGRIAVREIERVRGQFAAGSMRASYTAARSDVYADLVIALLRLGRTEEAFAVSDAARGRALLDHIAAAGQAVRRSGTADRAQAEQVLRRIDTLMRRLRVADTVPPRRRSLAENTEIGFLGDQLAGARREYEALLERFASSNAGAAVLLGGAMPSVTAVASAVGDEEALVEYHLATDRLLIFVVRGRTVRCIEAAVTADELGTRVRQARELLAQRHAGVRPVLRALDEMLMEPLRKDALLRGVRRLLIVPHATLAYLPFSALIAPDGSYLMERFSLLMLPSSASLAAIRNQPTDTSAVARGTAIVTPFPEALPGSRAESEAIRRLVAESFSHLGKRATETVLRDELQRRDVVHVATHGVLVGQNPMFSRLELAAGAEQGSGASNNGRLEVHELLDVEVRASLVFLSGCETGAGAAWSNSYIRGEDYATLGAAFLYAGARNVVATLWRIEDRGAAAFATAFYEALTSHSPVEALATAQRELLRHGSYGTPFHWAAYTLTGEGVTRAVAAVSTRGPQNAAVVAVK